MNKYLLAYLLIIITTHSHAQMGIYNITKLDSTENFFTKIQSEIKIKTIGIYTDTIFTIENTVHQIIKYNNFQSTNEVNSIFTIIDKYEFKNGRVEKVEHWKTNNTNTICKCGDWQYKRKGLISLHRLYPKCNYEHFICSTNGDPLK